MTNLQRRLKKIEARLTDNAGLVPYSPRWLAYWIDRIDRVFSETDTSAELIPLEVLDAWFLAHEG